MRPSSRRQMLGGGALAALGALTALKPGGPASAQSGMTGMDHSGSGGMEHGGGHKGPTMRKGERVDHKANGFNPTDVLRDFDYGKVSKLPSGQTLREWEIVAADKDIEIAPGIVFPAWTYNGRVPGPTIRATEGDRVRIKFVNGGTHPHTMHFHGIHTSAMDGVPMQGDGLIAPGKSTVYEFDADPFGMHLYHCHAGPLAEHIARGMYGAYIVDPKEKREEADEMMMMLAGFNTTLEADSNQVYAANTVAFHFMHEPIKVKQNKLIRIYLGNMLEYDPINSFHLHANFFNYFPTGTSRTPSEFTDTLLLGQGQRGILELRFPYTGQYMFHSHKSEFADLGWMSFFEVEA